MAEVTVTAVVGRRVLGVPTVFGSRYGVPLPTDSGPARSGWFERVAARPATIAAYAKGEQVRPAGENQMTEEAKKILFGQTAKTGV